jgi:hypothetical protein
MNEPFTIAVFYQGTEHEFKARFERWGYTHRFAVLIDEITITFEPDEEGNYRALTETSPDKIHRNLLQAVAEKLGKLSS